MAILIKCRAPRVGFSSVPTQLSEMLLSHSILTDYSWSGSNLPFDHVDVTTPYGTIWEPFLRGMLRTIP